VKIYITHSITQPKTLIRHWERTIQLVMVTWGSLVDLMKDPNQADNIYIYFRISFTYELLDSNSS